MRDKLVRYSLDPTHVVGGPKARAFERILGITLTDLDYLEAAIREAILTARVSEIRGQTQYGLQCGVRIGIRGLGAKRGRTVTAITAWEFAHPDAPPRMTNAYLRPRLERNVRH